MELSIAIGSFVLGLLIGRLTARKEKSTTIYQPVASREIAQANPQIEEMIRAGNKIDAIKLFRANYGIGLKEAKDAVDAIESQLKNP